jgi:hypothetical protein
LAEPQFADHICPDDNFFKKKLLNIWNCQISFLTLQYQNVQRKNHLS